MAATSDRAKRSTFSAAATSLSVGTYSVKPRIRALGSTESWVGAAWLVEDEDDEADDDDDDEADDDDGGDSISWTMLVHPG
jgi:hypothetical protein